jgi:hypothetical protein
MLSKDGMEQNLSSSSTASGELAQTPEIASGVKPISFSEI